MTRNNTKPYVVGIDPGSKGGIACLRVDDEGPVLLYVEDLPYLGGRPDTFEIRRLLDQWGVIHAVYLEKAQVMPARGPDGAERPTGTMGRFNYGVGYGMVLATVQGLDVPVEEVPPNTWKRSLRLGSDKGEARALAKKTFPNMRGHFERVRDDGRAEAALIARYGAAQWVKTAA